jgi:hypothetical protein
LIGAKEEENQTYEKALSKSNTASSGRTRRR